MPSLLTVKKEWTMRKQWGHTEGITDRVPTELRRREPGAQMDELGMANTVNRDTSGRAKRESWRETGGRGVRPCPGPSWAWLPPICGHPEGGPSPALLHNLEKGAGRGSKFGIFREGGMEGKTGRSWRLWQVVEMIHRGSAGRESEWSEEGAGRDQGCRAGGRGEWTRGRRLWSGWVWSGEFGSVPLSWRDKALKISWHSSFQWTPHISWNLLYSNPNCLVKGSVCRLSPPSRR